MFTNCLFIGIFNFLTCQFQGMIFFGWDTCSLTLLFISIYPYIIYHIKQQQNIRLQSTYIQNMSQFPYPILFKQHNQNPETPPNSLLTTWNTILKQIINKNSNLTQYPNNHNIQDNLLTFTQLTNSSISGTDITLCYLYQIKKTVTSLFIKTKAILSKSINNNSRSLLNLQIYKNDWLYSQCVTNQMNQSKQSLCYKCQVDKKQKCYEVSYGIGYQELAGFLDSCIDIVAYFKKIFEDMKNILKLCFQKGLNRCRYPSSSGSTPTPPITHPNPNTHNIIPNTQQPKPSKQPKSKQQLLTKIKSKTSDINKIITHFEYRRKNRNKQIYPYRSQTNFNIYKKQIKTISEYLEKYSALNNHNQFKQKYQLSFQEFKKVNSSGYQEQGKILYEKLEGEFMKQEEMRKQQAVSNKLRLLNYIKVVEEVQIGEFQYYLHVSQVKLSYKQLLSLNHEVNNLQIYPNQNNNELKLHKFIKKRKHVTPSQIHKHCQKYKQKMTQSQAQAKNKFVRESFENQTQGIKIMGSYIYHQYISSYYVKQLNKNSISSPNLSLSSTPNSYIQNIQQLYSIKYPKKSWEYLNKFCKYSANFDDFIQKLRKIIKFAIELCTGIYFIHGCELVHRDLKFDNIVIDEDGKVKIIDFGSCCPYKKYRSSYNKNTPEQAQQSPTTPHKKTYRKQPNPNFHYKLKSTKGYHLEHSEIPASIINKYNLVESFQQHKLTDMYSFGVIFEKLIPMQELKKNSVFDDFRDFVDLFIRKCKDFNPDDRYQMVEAVIYLKLLGDLVRSIRDYVCCA